MKILIFLFKSIFILSVLDLANAANSSTDPFSTFVETKTTTDTTIKSNKKKFTPTANISIDFLHFYNFFDDEKILPIYIVVAVEWKYQEKGHTKTFKENDELIDYKKWLPLLDKPILYIESNGAKNILDEENEYQYLIYKENKLIYITRLYFQLKCSINGPMYPHETKFCHLLINSGKF